MGRLGITLALGGSIAAVVMVIGMITIVAGTATTSTSSMELLGHYTIRIMNSDGSVKAYIQADNAPTHLFKHCMFDAFMGSTLNTAEGAGKTCGISDGNGLFRIGDAGETAPTDADLALTNAYSDTGAADRTGQTVSVGGTEATVTWDNVNDPIVIIQTDLEVTPGTGNPTGNIADGVCVDENTDTLIDCFLDEVGLFDDNDELISHAAFTPTINSRVSAGDLVDMTLTITLQ